jgi:PTH1 family peptidyl-tRNA hydrolase
MGLGMSEALRMIVGLGNPGKDYVGTRHNVGFAVLDGVADRAGVGFKSERQWQGHVTKLPGGVVLLKPMTYMNLSGRAVAAVARFYKIMPAGILVVHDDVALPVGQLRFRQSGGAGGHNGLKSLIADLGTNDFPRLKIGIGDVAGEPLTGHVLGRFGAEEQEEVENTLARAVEAVQLALAEGVGAGANAYNAKQQSKNTDQDEPEI